MQHYSYSDFVTAVARRLRQLRIEGGFSQRSFSKQHGWISSHWALIEKGKKMSLRNLIHAAHSFNMTIDQLLAEAVRHEGPDVGSPGYLKSIDDERKGDGS